MHDCMATSTTSISPVLPRKLTRKEHFRFVELRKELEEGGASKVGVVHDCQLEDLVWFPSDGFHGTGLYYDVAQVSKDRCCVLTLTPNACSRTPHILTTLTQSHLYIITPTHSMFTSTAVHIITPTHSAHPPPINSLPAPAHPHITIQLTTDPWLHIQ